MCRGLAQKAPLWYNDRCHTGDDGWVLCGVMPRILSGPEGSSNKRKLARAAGKPGLNPVVFCAKAPKPGRFLCLRGLAALVLVHPRVHPLQKRLRRQALLKIVDRVPHAEGQRAGQRAGLL